MDIHEERTWTHGDSSQTINDDGSSISMQARHITPITDLKNTHSSAMINEQSAMSFKVHYPLNNSTV